MHSFRLDPSTRVSAVSAKIRAALPTPGPRAPVWGYQEPGWARFDSGRSALQVSLNLAGEVVTVTDHPLGLSVNAQVVQAAGAAESGQEVLDAIGVTDLDSVSLLFDPPCPVHVIERTELHDKVGHRSQERFASVLRALHSGQA